MSIVIKPLAQEHFQQSMDLSSFAFQFPLTQEQLNERSDSFINNDQLRLGVFEGEQLCAQATLLHLHTYIGGKVFSMGGIAGVSTWPEHRRHGYVASLLSELLIIMREQGQSISMLHPFSFAFYRKFGWESFVDHKTIELSSEHLSAILKNAKQRKLSGKIVRLNDWEKLQHVYNRYALRYNGMLQRSSEWWQTSVAKRKKGVYAAYENNEGVLEGYLIYEVTNRQMNIHEFICLTNQSEQALLNYIAQHDSMVHHVSWITQKDDEILFNLDNPRAKQETVPYFMARIVDVESFITQFPFLPSDSDEQFNIRIEDQHADWNNGSFLLTINRDGKAQIIKSSERSTEEILISIGALTAWLLYYQNWDTLVRFEKASGMDDVLKRLQRRIPANRTYLTDFF